MSARKLQLRADVKVSGNSRRKTVVRHRTVANMTDALAIACEDERHECRASVTGSESFTGTEKIHTYRDMLRDGWSLGVQDVEGLDGLSTDASEKLSFVRGVGGAFPIVPAHLAGAPDAMLMPTHLAVDNVRGLTLVIDGAFNCSINSETVKEYAHSVMRLVAWLQAEQIETAIYISIAMQHAGGRYVYAVPVRQAGDIMQPERIAALVHPSFLRRAWFALLEHEHFEHDLVGTDLINNCYGYPSTATAEEIQVVIPEAYSVVMLPKAGNGDPLKAVQESDTFKLRHEGS